MRYTRKQTEQTNDTSKDRYTVRMFLHEYIKSCALNVIPAVIAPFFKSQHYETSTNPLEHFLNTEPITQITNEAGIPWKLRQFRAFQITTIRTAIMRIREILLERISDRGNRSRSKAQLFIVYDGPRTMKLWERLIYEFSLAALLRHRFTFTDPQTSIVISIAECSGLLLVPYSWFVLPQVH